MRINVLFIVLVIGMLVSSCSKVETPTRDVIDVPEGEVAEAAEEPVIEGVPEPEAVEVPEAKEEIPESGDATIKIQAGFFEPEELTIPIGTTVTWVNNDMKSHGITDVRRTFHKSRIPSGETFSFTFTEAGEYDYFDVVFYSVKGKIIVEE